MDGATAILNASHFGHADAVAQLLEAGADVESRDAHDMTPITAAIAMGHAGVVKVIVGYLHHRGLTAQVMERMDSRNFSPLHWAASVDEPAVMSELLAIKTLSLGIKNALGLSPLDVAAAKGNSKVVPLLLESDRAAAALDGAAGAQRAQDIANDSGHCATAELIARLSAPILKQLGTSASMRRRKVSQLPDDPRDREKLLARRQNRRAKYRERQAAEAQREEKVQAMEQTLSRASDVRAALLADVQRLRAFASNTNAPTTTITTTTIRKRGNDAVAAGGGFDGGALLECDV